MILILFLSGGWQLLWHWGSRYSKENYGAVTEHVAAAACIGIYFVVIQAYVG